MRRFFGAAAVLALVAAPLPGLAQERPASEIGTDHVKVDDLDLMAADGRRLGEVENAVLDAQGRLAGYVVEIEGRGDRDVFVPVDAVRLERDQRGRAVLRTDAPIDQFREAPRHLR